MIDIAEIKYEAARISGSTKHHMQKIVREPMAYLMIKSPFFAHVLYQECTVIFTEEVPIAATDGKCLYFNIDALIGLGWNIPEIAFVVCHEIAHVVLGDLAMMAKWKASGWVDCGNGVVLPYVHQLMNAAQDFRINAMLIEANIGQMPSVGLYDPKYSDKGMESSVEIYAKLYKDTEGGKKDRRPPDQPRYGKPRSTGEGFDIHLEPAPEHVKTVEGGRIQQIIAQASMASEGQGAMPAAIKRMIGDILEPKVSWQDFLSSTIRRAAGDPQYDWTTIDRRLIVRPDPIYFARQAHTGMGNMVIGCDTSGSTVKMIDRFFAEMNGIVGEMSPRNLTVIWCDAAVHRVDELEDVEDLLELHAEVNAAGGPGGGGGTKFEPVFEKAAEMQLEPQLLVYITDGHGSFPKHEPDYPVIWAIIKGGNTKVPFGTVVEVEL